MSNLSSSRRSSRPVRNAKDFSRPYTVQNIEAVRIIVPPALREANIRLALVFDSNGNGQLIGLPPDVKIPSKSEDIQRVVGIPRLVSYLNSTEKVEINQGESLAASLLGSKNESLKIKKISSKVMQLDKLGHNLDTFVKGIPPVRQDEPEVAKAAKAVFAKILPLMEGIIAASLELVARSEEFKFSDLCTKAALPSTFVSRLLANKFNPNQELIRYFFPSDPKKHLFWDPRISFPEFVYNFQEVIRPNNNLMIGTLNHQDVIARLAQAPEEDKAKLKAYFLPPFGVKDALRVVGQRVTFDGYPDSLELVTRVVKVFNLLQYLLSFNREPLTARQLQGEVLGMNPKNQAEAIAAAKDIPISDVVKLPLVEKAFSAAGLSAKYLREQSEVKEAPTAPPIELKGKPHTVEIKQDFVVLKKPRKFSVRESAHPNPVKGPKGTKLLLHPMISSDKKRQTMLNVYLRGIRNIELQELTAELIYVYVVDKIPLPREEVDDRRDELDNPDLGLLPDESEEDE